MHRVFTIPHIGDVSPVKFNAILAAISGALFFSGWWIMFALLAENLVTPIEFLPGLFGSVALVVVNAVPTHVILQPNSYFTDTCYGPLLIRTCLLIGFMIAFGSLIGACYILFADYILNKQELNKWPGYGVLLQNLFIFGATVILRCTVPKDQF